MGEAVREVGAREWDEEVTGSIAEERTGRIRILKLDMEANSEVAMQHEVRSAPTLVLFSGGAELGRVVGFLPKGRLENRLDEALAAAL